MDRKEEVSRVLFGSEKRLDLLLAISRADDSECYPTAMAEVSGVAAGATSVFMRKLADVDLLLPMKEEKGSTLRRYQKSDSVLWELVERLHEEL